MPKLQNYNKYLGTTVCIILLFFTNLYPITLIAPGPASLIRTNSLSCKPFKRSILRAFFGICLSHTSWISFLTSAILKALSAKDNSVVCPYIC
jgi:hypothetical protein